MNALLKKYQKINFLLLAYFLIVILPFALLGKTVSAEVVYQMDFTQQPDGDAIPWLEKHGFEFQLGAKKLNPRFENHKLVISTSNEEAGLFIKEINVKNAKYIKIKWGVDKYPEGASWDDGIYRVPIAVMVSFGKQKVDSGSVVLPNSPYFIGLFLGEKDQEEYAYTGKYYQKGGRYFCALSGGTTEKTVTTMFNLDEAFKEQFKKGRVPFISSFSFQMNTKDTQGEAEAFIESIEFLTDMG
ncbi:hypothetical protein [Candidatus Nitrosacidococcus tergens]|uniref:Uncharacterized protein n=1 Tax=Candidatus Nitrosacidococcus tergens TaxID=553981 RepID=A0A7G1Q978_9GAMM|nr:hypothetical protein [Candidatus Nitrosacidococcus tergens]CAB1275619.1 conserved protein of unknown function [Candidatus Nitrosacidococcus tergens]